MGTPRPTGTFCWSELATTDVDAAIAFYSTVFGWRTSAKDVGEMGSYTMVHLGDDDIAGMFPLSMMGSMAEGVPPHWSYYVKVTDVAATAAKAIKLGGTVLQEEMEIPGVGKMATLQDPTGARLSLFAAGGHDGITAGPMEPGGFGWCELQTRDTASAKKFYTKLFGWQTKHDEGPMAYTEWTLPGIKQFGGMIEMSDQWGDAPPAWMGYVLVEDCDATSAKARKNGAHDIVPPTTIDGVGRFSVISDPQGAVLAFIKLFPHGA